MVGFWAEYAGVCAWRKLRGIVGAIAATIGNLLLLIVRPFVLGILTFVEDLTSPFTRMASGLRHIRELPNQLEEEDAGQIRAAKMQYFRRGVKKYYPSSGTRSPIFLPALAAVALVVVVRNGLNLRFVLNVQVNGESVGYVANEQVFENARDDVQSRINTAKSMLVESGANVPGYPVGCVTDLYTGYFRPDDDPRAKSPTPFCAQPAMRLSMPPLCTLMANCGLLPPRAIIFGLTWKASRSRMRGSQPIPLCIRPLPMRSA